MEFNSALSHDCIKFIYWYCSKLQSTNQATFTEGDETPVKIRRLMGNDAASFLCVFFFSSTTETQSKKMWRL